MIKNLQIGKSLDLVVYRKFNSRMKNKCVKIYEFQELSYFGIKNLLSIPSFGFCFMKHLSIPSSIQRSNQTYQPIRLVRSHKINADTD